MTVVAPPIVSAAEIARVVGDVVPTPEQCAAIEAPLAPALVIAGAGAGKTATMAARVVYLVVNGLARPEEILALTFTRKAAGEISDRVRAKLAVARHHFPIPDDGVQPTMSTYNAFAAGLVRDHALRLGRDPDATLVTRAGAWQIMDRIVQTWPEEVEADLTPATVVDRALTLADALRTNLLTVDEARDGLERLVGEFEQPRDKAPTAALRAPADKLRTRLALLELVRAHEGRKRELSVVEFSDQVALACEIARQVPAVGTQLRAQFKVVLLDEFQDTSVAQLDLLADLFGRGHAVMAVGDPNQAIYGWRGASAASLTGFRARFGSTSAPVTTLSLTTSWRNDEAILEAANALSRPLRAAGGDEGVLLGPLGPRPGAGRGAVDVSVSLTPSGEAGAIARWLQERWAPGTGRSAAVLCRARKQFMPVLRALRDRGLPASVVGLGGLLHVPEVVDLRSALQVAHDASRGDALMRLLTNERLGVADLRVLTDWSRELARVGGDGGSATIVEALDELPPPGWANPDGHSLSTAGRARLERLRRTLRRVREFLVFPLPDLVVAVEQELGLDIEVAARAGADPGAARANLDSFTGHAATYAAGALAPTLGGFLAWLEAAEANENGLDIEPVDVTTNAVQLMTVHAAKGLEWDVVVVAGLSEGQFPSCRRTAAGSVTSDGGWLTRADEFPYPLRGDSSSLPALATDAPTCAGLAADIEDFKRRNMEHLLLEERRLAYVAVTRARSQLLLSASRFLPGVARPVPPACFLGEVAARVPPGFTVVPEPADHATNPDLVATQSARYPLADPAGERRARLDRAASLVTAARCELDAAIGPVSAGSALRDHLAALELEAARAPGRVAAFAEQARLLLAEAVESAAASVDVGTHLSASAAIALTTAPEAFALRLRRPVPARPSRRAQVGSEFHAWVEHHFGAPALLYPDEAEESPEAGESGDLDLAQLRARFLASPWAARTPAAVEVDLETAVAGHVIRCRIDAVFETGVGAEVVDWKTGRPPVDRTELDSRQMQLALYRLAWSRAACIPLDHVTAAFVHVADGITIRADQWTEAQIEERFARAFAVGGSAPSGS